MKNLYSAKMALSAHKTATQNSTQTMRFHPASFIGKERDEETGYSYFGARYMDHELMTMWLSVDPLADKYPNISPYAYCHWNPIVLVDPPGESDRKFVDYETGEFLGETDDGVNETVRITVKDYETLKKLYEFDLAGGDENLTKYNSMIEIFSLGKIAYDIAQTAKGYAGSKEWATEVRKDNFPAGTHKCNKFIYDILALCGIAPSPIKNEIPRAINWVYLSTYDFSGFTIINGMPHVGDIIAGRHDFNDASGHLAIVTSIDMNNGKVQTISAGSKEIHYERFGDSVLKGKAWDKKKYSPVSIIRYSQNSVLQ